MPEGIETATRRIEIVDINDHDASQDLTEPIVPHERQIVDDVIAIWKLDPETESLGVAKLHALVKERHPNWNLGEKRVKALLRKFGLLTNTDQEQFTYANEIKSDITPDIELPEKVEIVVTKKRGKCLYAKKDIKKGELIWQETELFFVPPLENAELIQLGKACSYCGKVLTQSSRKSSGASVLRGLDCNVCPEIWCSQACKKVDFIMHGLLKHNVYNPNSKKSKKIDSEAFHDLHKYCVKEQWNALYAITLIHASIILDKTNVKGKQFGSMALVSQAVRYKALSSSAGAFDSLQGGALFVQEQQEELWNEGYKKFSSVFPNKDGSGVTFEEFLVMMGTYNINNVDNCIYLIRTHLNHNCDPNTDVVSSTGSRTEGLKVYAARDIRAGEELTTTYVNPSHTLDQRQRELRVNWGFICTCERCKSERKEQHRRKSSSAKGAEKADIRKMLAETEGSLDGQGFELEIPQDANRERRKSVRFDEKVTVSK